MSTFTQTERLLSLSTPLGDDVLLLTGMRGQEVLSQPFAYQLSVLSERGDITAKDLVGKNVTWSINHTSQEPRLFNGYVSRLAAAGKGLYGLRAYELEVVPWLWFLTRSADTRIHFPDLADKTVKDVLREVFADFPIADFADHNLSDDNHIGDSYPKREYWVQYRETAFNFVSRLMEDAGIFYYWLHHKDKHTMVLCDRRQHYGDCTERFVPFSAGGSRASAQITAWKHEWEARSGQMAHTDYNFEKPKTPLLTETRSIINLPALADYQLFDYPGDYQNKGDGFLRLNVRMEEEETPFHVVRGESNCATFFPGGKFTLSAHELHDEEQKTYVLTRVEHHAIDTTFGNEGESSYRNTFTCIPEKVTFRPRRATPRPVVHGVQTAVVVGPRDDEIYTDPYGRIKVQFHWDRRGHLNEHSSCWLRVATPWAGKHWGMIHIPRIGQEVVVEFLEGDPDRPLVVGSVYNAEQMPPYELPKHKTQSGVKSRSSLQGSAHNFNEIRFEDLKGCEEVIIHAERNMARSVEVDDNLTVGHNSMVNLGTDDNGDPRKDGKLNAIIFGDTSVDITKGDFYFSVIEGRAVTQVEKEVLEEYHNRQVTTVTKEIEIESLEEHIAVKAKKNIDLESTAESIGLKAAKKIVLTVGKSSLAMDADGNIHLKGVNLIVEGSDNVTLKPKVISVEGSESVTVKNKLIQIQGDSEVKIKGGAIHSEADGENTMKGKTILSSATGVNTIVGSTKVDINP